jgi:hypothetical protein
VRSLINPHLYEALKRIYKGVTVIDPGISGDFERKVVSKDGKSFVSYVTKTGGSQGERYRFDCPWCGDKKKRFYVSYLFGQTDPHTGHVNYGNIKCFNEDCQRDWLNRKELWEDVDMATFGAGGGRENTIAVAEGGVIREAGEIGKPGICVRFDEIPEGSKDFAAVRYMRDERGFDLDILQDFYGVRYLKEAYTIRSLAGRIWTPFYRNQALIAYTTRAVPQLCDTDIPHWHSPGGLGGLLYGLRGALKHRVLSLIEGPADKWATGDPGVALLGKSLAGQKVERLMRGLYSSSVEAVAVILDPNQNEKEAARGEDHQIKKAVETVRKFWAGIVVPVYLPDQCDPGGCSRDVYARLIYQEFVKNGHPKLGEVLARDVYRSSAARIGPSRIGGKPASIR